MSGCGSRWGSNLPLWQQFIHYVGDVLHGDFGTSVLTSQPVLDDIRAGLPGHAGTGDRSPSSSAWCSACRLGVFAAVHRGRWPDQLIRVVGLLGYSVPVFWLGLVGLLLFYARLGWVGGPGRLDVFYDGLVDPVTGVLLIDSLLAGETEIFWNALSPPDPAGLDPRLLQPRLHRRMTRSFMLDQLRQEYVTTARVKGVSERPRDLAPRARQRSAVPLITVMALSYAGLLEGSVLTETVFSWPGLGHYITNALLNADMNAVLGGTLVVGAVFIGLNMLSDVLYRLLDPRAR